MTANTSVGQEHRWGARAAALAVGFALAAMAGGASASAATVLGAPEFQNPGSQTASNQTMIQTTSPGNGYAAPTDGVITSWGKFASANPSNLQQLKLKIARLVAGQYQIVGESALQTLTVVNAKNTFNARIPVKAGDVIGLYTANSGPVSVAVDFPYSHEYLGEVGDTPMSGVVNDFSGGRQLVVYATHELDADNDGFGDDSQDKCKGQAGTNNGCPPAKKKKCKKKKKKGNSAAATAKKKGCKKKKK